MKKSSIILIIIFVALLAIDQLAKGLLITHATINSRFIFGFGPSFDLFFWTSTLVIILLALYLLGENLAQKICLSVMAVGAVSNLIDRFFRGGVVDFIHLNLIENMNFNLADLFLIIGFFSYLYFLGRENEKNSNH